MRKLHLRFVLIGRLINLYAIEKGIREPPSQRISEKADVCVI